MQDIIIFPKIFDDYDEYKVKVPFLIPTRRSIMACLKRQRGV
ncbi:MAG: hypothetical protein RR420_05885 [Anaerovoracaceae bacterium]